MASFGVNPKMLYLAELMSIVLWGDWGGVNNHGRYIFKKRPKQAYGPNRYKQSGLTQPVQYSQGFHTNPKTTQASPLAELVQRKQMLLGMVAW